VGLRLLNVNLLVIVESALELNNGVPVLVMLMFVAKEYNTESPNKETAQHVLSRLNKEFATLDALSIVKGNGWDGPIVQQIVVQAIKQILTK